MAITDYLPSFLGGTYPAASADATNQALASLGAGVYGPETPAQYQAAGGTIQPSSSIAGDATAISKALDDYKKSLDPSQDSGSGLSSLRAQAGTAQSGTGQGSTTGINDLLAMIAARANQYFPGQPNRQPVDLKRPSGRGGLLGL